jgi:hypothetical protein
MRCSHLSRRSSTGAHFECVQPRIIDEQKEVISLKANAALACSRVGKSSKRAPPVSHTDMATIGTGFSNPRRM